MRKLRYKTRQHRAPRRAKIFGIPVKVSCLYCNADGFLSKRIQRKLAKKAFRRSLVHELDP